MEPSYVILTETSGDLTPELAQRAGVEVLPMTFTMDGETHVHHTDWRELSFDDFYGRLRNGSAATTSAVNIAELSAAMETHLQRGQDILFLCFSSGLSSSREACAMAAAELRETYPDRTIETVDTLSASIGQGLLALLAGERRSAGDSLEQTRDYVEQTKLHIGHWFTVDDLMYLKRGGRLSAASAAVGTMLQIKPILRVDNQGRLVTADKVRGRKAAIQTLVRHMEETALPDQRLVLIGHAQALEDAQTLRSLVAERFHPEEIVIVPQGPIIGSHTGPGFLALTFLASGR